MIIGAHWILYSKRPEADRAFFGEVLGRPSVDVGGGWLIFGLPPAEVAIHPSEEDGVQELYLMCEDVAGFVRAMAERRLSCGPVLDRGWGLLTEVTLPGGGKLGVYQPRHARPKPMTVGARGAKAGKTAPRTDDGRSDAGPIDAGGTDRRPTDDRDTHPNQARRLHRQTGRERAARRQALGRHARTASGRRHEPRLSVRMSSRPRDAGDEAEETDEAPSVQMLRASERPPVPERVTSRRYRFSLP